MNNKLIFINYISRSGSTFLCQLLDDYASISVGIEAGFPGHPTRILPSSNHPIQQEDHLEQYLDELFNDIRFKAWNIDKTNFKKELLSNGYPITFNIILSTALKQYFQNNDSEAWIHKAGYFIDCLDEARAIFPTARHIYIQRDPRAIFNSQKNAKSIYHNRPMGLSIVNFIKQYRNRTQIAEYNKNQQDFLFVQYEDIISNKNSVIEKVINFIELSNKSISSNSNYSSKIPDNQKALHKNVGSTINKSSLDKWQKGLTAAEILFIENKLSDIFISYKYSKSNNLNMKPKDYIQYITLNLKYWAKEIKSLYKRNAPFIRTP